MSKHILIIGGMGPQASVYAHTRLLELARQGRDAFSNEDYPRITHLSINVQDFISDPSAKKKAEKYIISCLQDINLDNVDSAFIACNTAHLLYGSIKALLGNKLVSMVDTVRKEIKPGSVGIVATPSTINAHLYDGGSQPLVTPDAASLQRLEVIIRQVISGISPEDLASKLQKEIDALTNRGARKVILGCSELSMFNSYLNPTQVIDPIESILRKLMEK